MKYLMTDSLTLLLGGSVLISLIYIMLDVGGEKSPCRPSSNCIFSLLYGVDPRKFSATLIAHIYLGIKVLTFTIFNQVQFAHIHM